LYSNRKKKSVPKTSKKSVVISTIRVFILIINGIVFNCFWLLMRINKLVIFILITFNRLKTIGNPKPPTITSATIIN
jgi:hypothetical protein